MPTEVISNIYLNYGILGLIVIGFFCLLVHTIRTNMKREEKLYIVIASLAKEFPEFRKAIEKQSDMSERHGTMLEKQGEAISRIEQKIK